MKRIQTAILTAVLCLCLCACQRYEKVDIPRIWASVASSNSVAPLNRIGAPAGTPYELVSITMDNWQEYLEFVPGVTRETDDFGDVTYTDFWTNLCIKEDYVGKILLNESELTVELTNERVWADIQFLLEYDIYTVGKIYEREKRPIHITFTLDEQRRNSLTTNQPPFRGNTDRILYQSLVTFAPRDLPQSTQKYAYGLNNYSVTRIQGHLAIAKNR